MRIDYDIKGHDKGMIGAFSTAQLSGFVFSVSFDGVMKPIGSPKHASEASSVPNKLQESLTSTQALLHRPPTAAAGQIGAVQPFRCPKQCMLSPSVLPVI